MPDIEDLGLYKERILGLDAEQFFKTDLGHYVLDRSLTESEELTAELKKADPEDSKKIRDLQNRIQTAEKTLIWLHEAIERGREAIQQLETKDELTEE